MLAFQRTVGNHAVSRALRPLIQRWTTIVDNPADPTNAMAPGTGRGMLATDVGTPQQAIHPTVGFGPLRNGVATEMDALLIPRIDDLGGSEPQQGTWPPWWQANKPTSSAWWVRGHLLNHNLAGPGEPRNLTPITKKCNSQHHSLVERLCKAASERGWSLAYQVNAQYSTTGPALDNDRTYNPDPSVWPHLTTGFQCAWVFHDGNGNQKADSSQFIPNGH